MRMAVDRRRLRALPGVRFAKLLGTGTGATLGPGDVDLTRWAALTVWDDPADAARFDASAVGRGWAGLSAASARLDLRTLHSRGTWSGRTPFGSENGLKTDGPVLALTRARLAPARALTFWRAIPPVTAALHEADGVLSRFGIGEAPIGWQGTVSVWRSTAHLVEFAYRHPQHRAAIARTTTARWYAEELFARFAILDLAGDPAVLGWADGEKGCGGR
ncbi:monooxygenase [Catenuloplanes atrovinosus]|nr:monooxygenase [Catenuloplanes atrovinosus]